MVSRLEYHKLKRDLPTRAVERLIQFRHDRIAGCPMSMLEILHRSSLSRSTYAKDKVYAMLRLAFDKSTFLSEPRYGWRDDELCMRMTKSYISSKRSLDIIFVGEKSRRSSLNLPSWCPDFTEFPSWSRMDHIIKYVSGQDERTRLGVLGRRWRTTEGITMNERLCTIDRGLLKIKGAWVATINNTANIIGEPKLDKSSKQETSGSPLDA